MSGIQFADHENIWPNNRLKYRSDTNTRAKMKLLPVLGAILNFEVKELLVKVSMETVNKFTS